MSDHNGTILLGIARRGTNVNPLGVYVEYTRDKKMEFFCLMSNMNLSHHVEKKFAFLSFIAKIIYIFVMF